MIEKLMTVIHDEESISINIPLELLVFCQSIRPEEPYLITNKRAMANYIVENILDYSHEVGQAEIGATDFTDLLDRLFTEAYESAEDWLEPIDWE
jgi:hypothetical protein